MKDSDTAADLNAFTFRIEHEIPPQMIADTLVSAFEGGSNYWIHSMRWIAGELPGDETERDALFASTGLADNFRAFPFYWRLFVPGHRLSIDPGEGEDPVTLYRFALRRGLRTLAEKYPHCAMEIAEENGDADTGDTFLQCCLFGDVIYE